MSVINSDLKKIVDDWFDTNSTDIAQGLEITTAKDLLEYERNLFLIVMQLGGLIMAFILNTRLQDKTFQKYAKGVVMSKRARKYRHLNDPNTSILTLFGNTVKLKLRYYVPKRGQGQKRKPRRKVKNGLGVFPVLEVLGIHYKATPAMASDITRSVADGPSMAAVRERFCNRGISLDIKVIKRVSEAFAKTGLVIRNEWLKQNDPSDTPLIDINESFKGKRVLISSDGGRIRIRKNKRGRIASGMKRHGYNTNWREPKLLTIRIIDESGKVTRDAPSILDGTIGSPENLFKLLYAHLVARDIQHAYEIVCVADGAPWIWVHMIELLNDLDVDASKVHFVLDFYHAVEHLSAVADGKPGWNKWKRKKWLKQMKKRLKRGDVEGVILELKKLAKGKNAKKVKKEMRYFMKNKERMRYDIIMEKKLPIGSGAMESGIRQVVNMRLKSAGMFWKKENAEGFLHLRCYLKSKRWETIEQAVISYCPDMGARSNAKGC